MGQALNITYRSSTRKGGRGIRRATRFPSVTPLVTVTYVHLHMQMHSACTKHTQLEVQRGSGQAAVHPAVASEDLELLISGADGRRCLASVHRHHLRHRRHRHRRHLLHHRLLHHRRRRRRPYHHQRGCPCNRNPIDKKGGNVMVSY